MTLDGKYALVTGAGSGIGQAIAITFAREGASVVAHYGIDRQGAENIARQEREHGVRAEIVQADLADTRQAERRAKVPLCLSRTDAQETTRWIAWTRFRSRRAATPLSIR